MPLLQTSGNDTADAYAGGTAVVPVYIEDVMSTFLYTGNGSTQTITNGIDLAGKGGLVWRKLRSAAGDHILEDTVRGAGNYLNSNTANAQANSSTLITSFNTTGFTTGAGSNANGNTYASWTFRKQPKFFDVVTYTGDGTGLSRQIAHSLGSAPGCIIIKRTDAAQNWKVYHRSLGNNFLIELNITDAANNQGTQVWDSQTTYFSTLSYNVSGATYVAYLFAHNAGGFGLTGTDNVISCGSYTGTGVDPGPEVNLGYEPQWLLIKDASAVINWVMGDVMRGFYGYSGNDGQELFPNLTNAEVAAFQANVTPTGFRIRGAGGHANTLGETYIYIAIRRGPMKVPTSGTSVFAPVATSATAGTSLSVGFPADWVFGKARTFANGDKLVDRLRGFSQGTSTPDPQLITNSTAAETTGNTPFIYNVNNTTALVANGLSGNSSIYYFMGRAPNFFDEVCYTGTGSARTVKHNLGVAPELMIVKKRNSATNGDWFVYAAPLGATNVLNLNLDVAAYSYSAWNNTAPTSTVFSVTTGYVNSSGDTFVAYLFATCSGVSKVGSYTGTGTTKQVDCGFTGGARFVLIKRTDSTGNWGVLDTARGMVSGTDPYLNLNTTAAEVNANNVYTTTGGFQLVSSDANFNANGGSYIFLAIA